MVKVSDGQIFIENSTLFYFELLHTNKNSLD